MNNGYSYCEKKIMTLKKIYPFHEKLPVLYKIVVSQSIQNKYPFHKVDKNNHLYQVKNNIFRLWNIIEYFSRSGCLFYEKNNFTK